MSGESTNLLRNWLNSRHLSFEQFSDWVEKIPLLSIKRYRVQYYKPHIIGEDGEAGVGESAAAGKLAVLLAHANPDRPTISEAQVFGYQLVLEEVRRGLSSGMADC